MTATDKTAAAPRKRRSKPRRGPKVEDFPFPWRWWNGDYRVRGLTAEQRGKLMDALSYSVDSPTPGAFGEEELRGLLHLSPDEWAAQRGRFEPLFTVTAGARWVQKEFRCGFVRQFERLKRRSRAGKRNARKKWNALRLRAGGDANGMPLQCNGIHTPNPHGVGDVSTTVPALESDTEADAVLAERLDEICDRLERQTPPPLGTVLPGRASPQDLVGVVMARLARRGTG